MITVNSSKTLGELANWSMFLVFILIQSSLELAAIAILLEHEIPQMGLELQSHAAHIIHSVRTRDIHPHPKVHLTLTAHNRVETCRILFMQWAVARNFASKLSYLKPTMSAT